MPARGAESDAHRHFVLTSGSSREEKIADIGAGDEQNEEDDKHERRKEKKDNRFIARRKRAGLVEAETEIFLGVGMRLREMLGEELKLCGGFSVGDAGLEASDDGNPVMVALVEVAGVRNELIDVTDWHPELRVED